MRNGAGKFLVAALACIAIFIPLGLYVVHNGEPAPFWQFAKAVRGHDVQLAWFFTQFGWAQGFAGFFLIAIGVAVFSSKWRARMIYLMVTCLVTWGITDALQRALGRPRRGDWLIRHEHAFSYPSSHASTCTAFYLLAAVLILTSDLPKAARYAGFAVLALLWVAICWSRLALAAHYPTDVAGGILLGAAISLAGAAVLRLAGKTPAGV